MSKVLLINPTIYPEGVNRLKEEAEVILAPDGKPETLKHYLSKGIDGVITRLENIDGDVIRAARGLKVIGCNGAGFNTVDVDEATKAGVCVVNVVGANANSVAEHITMYTLAMARNIRRADAAVRKGDWLFRDVHTVHEIHGYNFCAIGFGNIGREVCRIMKNAFNMNVSVYDPFFTKEQVEKDGYRKVETLEDGVCDADYISLHLPSNKDTFHLVNMDLIKKMKRGCKFINCARGPIVDYDALCDALESGQIGMAGIDVYPEEPVKKEERILSLENVIASPHCAGDTVEARTRIAVSVANDVLAVIRGERPRCLVNHDIEKSFPNLFEK